MYKSENVAPIVRALQEESEGHIRAEHEDAVTGHRHTLLRWDSKKEVPADMTLNAAEAVALSRNKRLSRQAFPADITPATWFTKRDIELPCIVRPSYHHGGEQFFHCRSIRDVYDAIAACRPRRWYASAIVDKAREFRVFVFQGKVICVTEKFPPEGNTQIAWNLNQGGTMKNLGRDSWPPNVIDVAIKAMNSVTLDWGAVDVATDQGGRAFVFEVNTAPGLKNAYTIKQVMRAFRSLEPQAPEVPAYWKTVIHPSLLRTNDDL